MIAPPVPENEKQRQEFLKSLDILNTPIEERFERVTRIVCKVIGVPISAVSLIDNDRQWFKSIQGLDVSETSRDVSFCGHAILESKPMVVGDATKDKRFHDNPLVTGDPSIRFYAGVPLETAENIRIGTLCAIDSKPHQLSKEQLGLLMDLAGIIRSELMSNSISKANQELARELKEAEREKQVDPVTRLWNKEGGRNLLKKEIDNAIDKDRSLSLLFLDVDDFTSINNEFSYSAGDNVIKGLSEFLSKNIRPGEQVVHWEGEKFLLILPDCSASDVKGFANNLLENLNQFEFDVGTTKIQLQASMGGASCCGSQIVGDQMLLKVSDDALYSAKLKGRNQTHFIELNSGSNTLQQGVA